MCCASRCVCLDGQATYWVCGYANRQHELAEEIGDLEPFNEITVLKASFSAFS